MAGELRIGTSGWNYPSGRGKWDGIFYPPRRGRAKTFDELAFYAEHFNTVEINTTFYGQPRPEVSRSWAERTPPGFEFSVKLFQKFTHPGMYRERVRAQLPPAIATGDEAASELIGELARPTDADLDEFKRGIEPLMNAGKLGALLAQFPASFKRGDVERDYLTWLLRTFRDYRVALELRHRTWSDDVAGTVALMNACGAAWVQIDEPKFHFSIRQNYLPNVTTFYYMRLHGRNAAAWWRHRASEDRYNYLYSAQELDEIVDTARATREIVKKTYVYANNHFSAKSVANAAMIKERLGEPLTGEYPETFLTAYPELAPTLEAAMARERRRPGRQTPTLLDP